MEAPTLRRVTSMLESARNDQRRALAEGNDSLYEEATSWIEATLGANPQLGSVLDTISRSKSPSAERASFLTNAGFRKQVISEGINPDIYDNPKSEKYWTLRGTDRSIAAAKAAQVRLRPGESLDPQYAALLSAASMLPAGADMMVQRIAAETVPYAINAIDREFSKTEGEAEDARQMETRAILAGGLATMSTRTLGSVNAASEFLNSFMPLLKESVIGKAQAQTANGSGKNVIDFHSTASSLTSEAQRYLNLFGDLEKRVPGAMQAVAAKLTNDPELRSKFIADPERTAQTVVSWDLKDREARVAMSESGRNSGTGGLLDLDETVASGMTRLIDRGMRADLGLRPKARNDEDTKEAEIAYAFGRYQEELSRPDNNKGIFDSAMELLAARGADEEQAIAAMNGIGVDLSPDEYRAALKGRDMVKADVEAAGIRTLLLEADPRLSSTVIPKADADILTRVADEAKSSGTGSGIYSRREKDRKRAEAWRQAFKVGLAASYDMASFKGAETAMTKKHRFGANSDGVSLEQLYEDDEEALEGFRSYADAIKYGTANEDVISAIERDPTRLIKALKAAKEVSLFPLETASKVIPGAVIAAKIASKLMEKSRYSETTGNYKFVGGAEETAVDGKMIQIGSLTVPVNYKDGLSEIERIALNYDAYKNIPRTDPTNGIAMEPVPPDVVEDALTRLLSAGAMQEMTAEEKNTAAVVGAKIARMRPPRVKDTRTIEERKYDDERQERIGKRNDALATARANQQTEIRKSLLAVIAKKLEKGEELNEKESKLLETLQDEAIGGPATK